MSGFHRGGTQPQFGCSPPSPSRFCGKRCGSSGAADREPGPTPCGGRPDCPRSGQNDQGGDDRYDRYGDGALRGVHRQSVWVVKGGILAALRAIDRGRSGLTARGPTTGQPSGSSQSLLGKIGGSPEEPAVIRAALAECGGNVARAARRLGVPRGTLRYRIRKYGLDHLIPKD